MRSNDRKNNGLKMLCDGYRKAFRVPENLNYYYDEDLKEAEKNLSGTVSFKTRHRSHSLIIPHHTDSIKVSKLAFVRRHEEKEML
ncbi:MAG: hypothetical protein K9M96_04385 [Deltaproteobacteria bacterium]|nr:hypothetical protein [Deltaproteobacteria bacterium]MCF8120086.1 hypothetical protein [Deltaproteobacteria bacterium]